MRKEKYPKALLEIMWAVDDGDLPDGAWQQVIEDAVHAYNNHYKTRYDSFDAWLYYMQSEFREKKCNESI